MPDRYSIVRRGHHIEVENDWSLIIVSRERLFVDGRLVDERSVFWGEARLHCEAGDGDEVRPVTVEVSLGIFGGLERCVLIEGRLKTDKWQDSEGQNRQKLSVVCEKMQFVGNGATPNGTQKNGDDEEFEVPF